MNHGVSFLEVDNSAIQEAIKAGKSKDIISSLKQDVAFNAVYGFEYEEVPFDLLKNMLRYDYGFTPFKYARVEEGAIYNKEKHGQAWGRVRGRFNTNDRVTWVCLDVDDTVITDKEMHQILSKLNHHIARTSNKDNKCKYRIMLELDTPAIVSTELWKPFVKSIADSINIKIDNLGASQVFYGYKEREVYSVTNQRKLDPSTHLEMAHMKLAEIEEKKATAVSTGEASTLLQQPFSTFGFAYNAMDGDGTMKLLAAIHKAKDYGASSAYIYDLVHSINNFWDNSMPQHRLESTVLTAI